MSEWLKDGKMMKGTDKNLGGTMRLGSYEARLKKVTIAVFTSLPKHERHRHKCEVNINYKEEFEKRYVFSGLSQTKLRVNRIKKSPMVHWVNFIKFKSRPLVPHPLFSSFIKAQKLNR